MKYKKRKLLYVSVMLCLTVLCSCSQKEYGTEKNPAGVGQVMYYDGTEALKEKIEQVNENVRILYDMTFTAYQKTVPVDAVAVSGTQVIGYVSSEKADLSFGEEHIREILKNNKCKSVGVKLFREEKRFLDQLKQMNQKQSEHETTGSRKAEYICDVLRAIVL